MFYYFLRFYLFISAFGASISFAEGPDLSEVIFEKETKRGEILIAFPYSPARHERLLFDEAKKDPDSWVNVSFLATQLSELETKEEKVAFLSKKEEHITQAQEIYERIYAKKRSWIDFGIRIIFSRRETGEIIGFSSLSYNTMLPSVLELETYVFLEHRKKGYGTFIKEMTCSQFSRSVECSPVLQLHLDDGSLSSLYDYVEELDKKTIAAEKQLSYTAIASCVSLNNIPSMCINLRPTSFFVPQYKMLLTKELTNPANRNFTVAVYFYYSRALEEGKAISAMQASQLEEMRGLLLKIKDFSGKVDAGSEHGEMPQNLIRFWLELPLPAVSFAPSILGVDSEGALSAKMLKSKRKFSSRADIESYFQEIIKKNNLFLQQLAEQQDQEPAGQKDTVAGEALVEEKK